MPDPIAIPHDVRSRINLPDDAEGMGGVSDQDISTYLEDATFALAQVNDLETIEGDVREQLEWRLAAIDILTTRLGQRAYHSQSLGSMNRSYEVKMVEKLREAVGRICRANDVENPLTANAVGRVERDTERYVRSTTPNE